MYVVLLSGENASAYVLRTKFGVVHIGHELDYHSWSSMSWPEGGDAIDAIHAMAL